MYVYDVSKLCVPEQPDPHIVSVGMLYPLLPSSFETTDQQHVQWHDIPGETVKKYTMEG